MHRTLPDLLRETVKRVLPGHVALSFYGRTMIYRDLDLESDKFCAFLRSRGFRRGDRVMLLLPNCPQMEIACWGIWKAGCVMVALNPLLKSEELTAMMKLVRPKMFISLKNVKEFDDHNRAIIPNLEEGCQVVMTGMEDSLPWIKSLLYPLTTRRYRKERPESPPLHYPWRSIKLSPEELERYSHGEIPGPDDLAVLQFTGGTTGSVKAAMLTHANLVANTGQALDRFGDVVDEKSVVFSAIPCFHVYGLTVILVLAVARGAKVVMVPKFMEKKTVSVDGKKMEVKMITDEVIRVFNKEKITLIPGIPDIFSAMCADRRIKRVISEHLTLCVSGSGALPSAVRKNFEERFWCEIVEGYGLSETSPIVAINPRNSALPASLGIPVRDTEIRIVPEPDAKPEDGGELWVRGPQVMQGYWDNPEATNEALTNDGWFKTGDMARWEGEYLVMTDRKKDMIKVSGENVYPSEIEKILLDKLGVAEAHVVGVPDDRTGERIVACLVPQVGTRNFSLEEVRAACGGLGRIKIPKEVHNFSKEQIPRTYLGKVQKKELRKMLTQSPA